MQKWRLFSLSAHKYDCCALAIPPASLKETEWRKRNEQLPSTHRCSSSNWMAPNSHSGSCYQFFFFLYEHMSKLFGYCCHRQPNTREWAQETTPCVSTLPPRRRVNSQLRTGSASEASLQTDRPLHRQRTDSWSEWVTHSWAKAVVWDSCVRVQRFTEMREWFLQALFPGKKNWDVPLYNWVRSEK